MIDLWPVSTEVRAELIRNLTKSASESTKLPPSAFFVYVREYLRDAIGVGGVPLSQMVPGAGAPPK